VATETFLKSAVNMGKHPEFQLTLEANLADIVAKFFNKNNEASVEKSKQVTFYS
jgi:hypothetical protein